MREDGSNTGIRRIGTLALYTIPAVLAVAASIWLGVYIGVHNFNRQLTQEERAAIYTGASTRPAAPIKTDIRDNNSCLKITRVDIDGKSLAVYTENRCATALTYYPHVIWSTISPNGTILHEELAFCVMPKYPKDKAECLIDMVPYSFSTGLDSRTETIRVRID